MKELITIVIIVNIMFIIVLIYSYFDYKNSHFRKFSYYLDFANDFQMMCIAFLILEIIGAGLYLLGKFIYNLL